MNSEPQACSSSLSPSLPGMWWESHDRKLSLGSRSPQREYFWSGEQKTEREWGEKKMETENEEDEERRGDGMRGKGESWLQGMTGMNTKWAFTMCLPSSKHITYIIHLYLLHKTLYNHHVHFYNWNEGWERQPTSPESQSARCEFWMSKSVDLTCVLEKILLQSRDRGSFQWLITCGTWKMWVLKCGFKSSSLEVSTSIIGRKLKHIALEPVLELAL